MKVRVIIERCELKYVEQLKYKLEKMVVNFGMEIDDEAYTVMYVSVVDLSVKNGKYDCEPIVICMFENKKTGFDKNFTFKLYDE